ncbi:MAG: hypothetical protein NUV75_11405 [Gallionella sp.]|nr:hypothetical protein [Gallionella sp.]
MKAIIAVLSLVLLTAFNGCASTPTNPQQAVFSAKQSYAVALTVAVAYRRLPACGSPTATPICSKPDVVATLKKVDTASSALLDAAENTVRTQGAGANAQTAITAATQAVAAFQTITNALVTK